MTEADRVTNQPFNLPRNWQQDFIATNLLALGYNAWVGYLNGERGIQNSFCSAITPSCVSQCLARCYRYGYFASPLCECSCFGDGGDVQPHNGVGVSFGVIQSGDVFLLKKSANLPPALL